MSGTDTRPMGGINLDRRALVLGAALLAGGGVAMARQPRPAASRVETPELEKLIPQRIGDWTFQGSSGLVLPPSDALSDRLYDGLVTRSFTAPGRSPIMLLVAYSNLQDGMLQVHRPEVCYPAGGFELSPTRHLEIANGLGGNLQASAFSANGVSRTEQVLYWTRVGSRFPVRWSAQRLAVVEANLAGTIPDGILVRISNLEPDLAHALPDLTGFAEALIRQSGPQGRKLMVGPDLA